MKLIDIQRHFFRLRGDKNVYFCTDAETTANLNVIAVNYIRANHDETLPTGWETMPTRRICGSQINDIQVGEGLGMAYNPASEIRKLDTQVPDSMGDDTHQALAKLTKAVGGNVTDFVCERLRWSREEIEERLFAEQVDAVALAIYNMEARNQAMIIGDQTGIGKGRMAACLIRYANQHGMKPVFVTEKANLFSDIYRDLKDIGCADLKPFIVNTDSKANITEIDDDDNIRTVYRPLDSDKQKKVFASKRIPKEFDYVLCTYSQFNTPKRDADKIEFFKQITADNTIILDEAHNAGGSSKVCWKKQGEEDTREVKGSNTYMVFADAVKTAKNVAFLSATFAKRPDNFPIFAIRTCISESELNNTQLINSIAKGGEALQEILSSELVSCGQMLRRERTYDGIKVNYIYLNRDGENEFGVPNLEQAHRAISDNITELMRDIIAFEKAYITPMIDEANEAMADEGGSAKENNKEMGVSRASYFSKVFNVINQVLFSIKADAVADHAIRRLKEGKKVVIACASTFESLYSDLVADNDSARATEGDIVKTDYSEALIRGLQNTLKYSEKTAKNKTISKYLSFDELSPEAQEAYLEIENKIRHTTTGITISPIDYIIRKIQKAGYRCAEVTGRSKMIEFTNEAGTQGRITARKKVKANVAFAQFQNNQQDVLIINTSGSTGASAHATNKGTNLKREEVKPRVMIIAQCELNVSTEVQKRGRINRTGQFPELPPSYDYLISAIPAEARMMMMLQKKLRSLDANTASNQKNSTSVIDTDDFINKYGDEICVNFMKDNAEFTDAIGDPCGLFRDSNDPRKVVTEDIAKVVSGKVAVLPADEQENFYNTVLGNYKNKVAQLKARGEFDLEVEAMKLDAKFIRESALVPRTAGQSVFADASYLGVYECNVLRKPYTQEQVANMLQRALSGGNGPDMADELASRFESAIIADAERRKQDKQEQYERDLEALRTSPRNKKLVEDGKRTWIEIETELRNKFDSSFEKIESEAKAKRVKANIIRYFYAGRGVLMDPNTRGLCLGCTQSDKNGKNPFAPSSLTISFAVASSERSADFNLAEDGYKELLKIKEATGLLDNYNDHDSRTLNDWNNYTQKANANREIREIITGNILKGYEHGGDKAKLISFTMDNGEIRKGLLLAKSDKTGNESGRAVAYKAYPILKCREVLHRRLDEEKENPTYNAINLSSGLTMAFYYNSWGHYMQFTLRTAGKLRADKDIAMNQEWLQYERGFEMYRGKYELEIRSNENKEHEMLDNIINSLHRLGLKMELNAQQAEEYFADELSEPSKANGDWKTLKIDKSLIPASKKQPAPADNDRERRLRLAKARAKAMIMLQNQRNRNN